ncbi:hypothetical protein HYW74_03785 [Candidatus Pacearchaeota archaeon]|nr:hypothetical protein [Candidatus Pacearchaeota archaeon]
MPRRIKKESEIIEGDKDNSKLFAFLSVLLLIIGFILAIVVKRENRYVMFYAKQSLGLFIAWVVVAVIGGVLKAIIPVIGNIIYGIAAVILVVLWFFALVYSLSGEMKETPIIGSYVRGFRF